MDLDPGGQLITDLDLSNIIVAIEKNMLLNRYLVYSEIINIIK
jgi:hypothetical protein